MKAPKEIEIAAYDYALPEEKVAKYPLAERDQSKLLHYKQGEISETRFRNITEMIAPGSLLLFNNTKVIHARLLFKKETGANIEVFCLEPWQTVAPESFAQHKETHWLCLIGNNKKWKEGAMTCTLNINGKREELRAYREQAVAESWVVRFEWTGGASFAEVIETAGVIPLPPYLHREAEEEDYNRYQTVYAKHEGSVAAPTAGLHFTEPIFEALRNKNIDCEYITLQVGAGTFKPVSSTTIGEHQMHIEQIQISKENIEAILSHDTIIPVGTTTVRTIESVYWFGVKLSIDPHLEKMEINQWDCYELNEKAISKKEAYSNVLAWLERNNATQLYGATQLLIAPGYKYRVINKLITNFHQPKSTLLLLVSALLGEEWKRCYDYALTHDFRFLSYGDSCFFEP